MFQKKERAQPNFTGRSAWPCIRPSGPERGQWCLFTPELAVTQQRRVKLERQLRAALHTQALGVYYQPIVGLAGRQAVAFEALARWHDPELGWISPAEFIRVAEESGLIHDLGGHGVALRPQAGQRVGGGME